MTLDPLAALADAILRIRERDRVTVSRPAGRDMPAPLRIFPGVTERSSGPDLDELGLVFSANSGKKRPREWTRPGSFQPPGQQLRGGESRSQSKVGARSPLSGKLCAAVGPRSGPYRKLFQLITFAARYLYPKSVLVLKRRAAVSGAVTSVELRRETTDVFTDER
ncbi:hypothetical protein EVAR_71001_1 [Eumeta japonica]|uniref:Uncharacterized protein n=1 Tax=Eumeta variegata TaxID=151549 RepID=A0A4C2A9Y9_EUMVA|nr:hypothetical protein EVAR_71001_1 [Eumeta japonica]